jgi:hypothetical protein
LYAGVMESLRFIYPRMTDGGIIILDDYYDGSGGCMRATNAFASKVGLTIQLSTPSQVVLSVGKGSVNYLGKIFKLTTGPHTVRVATGRLERHGEFWRRWESIALSHHRRLQTVETFAGAVCGKPSQVRRGS